MKHNVDFRVYYEDTDAGGIMYHASFIRFCERSRTEMLRHLGVSCSELEQQQGLLFVVRHLDADYFKPAYLDDLLTVKTGIHEIKNSSFIMDHTIFRDDAEIFRMNATIVCVSKDGKPVRVPANIRDLFQPYEKS